MQQTSVPDLRFGPLQMGIIVLTLATAVIHWVLAANIPGMGMMSTLFMLNGIGYVVLLAALYLPQLAGIRRVVRWVLIAYTALTIVLWFTMSRPNTIGYIDKAVELVLIILLILEDWQRNGGVTGYGTN